MASAVSGLTQLTAQVSRLRLSVKPAAAVAPNSVAWRRTAGMGRMRMRVVVRAAPEGLSDKVAESVKEAEEKCAEDPASGECVAAWDEVEELSAAASHVRDRQKEQADPLENYCKDNPETDECRTYDN